MCIVLDIPILIVVSCITPQRGMQVIFRLRNIEPPSPQSDKHKYPAVVQIRSDSITCKLCDSV
jgi:hypothetical protein